MYCPPPPEAPTPEPPTPEPPTPEVPTPEVPSPPPHSSWQQVLSARLLIGWIVLICAELFSGAILPNGLWHPLTWLVVYWLYFAHFFFFTTLAIRTGRTSLSSLYLWGVLFGLYESWITKVIWQGYNHDFKPVMGHIGPYGFAEISMVFIFHPVMSFILPLTVACLLCPTLRCQFPGLVWLTRKSKTARCIQSYVVFCFILVMAVNSRGSGGPVNLALNITVAVGILWLLLRWAKPALENATTPRIVVFTGWGFVGLCVYLAFLYSILYLFMLPKGLPAAGVQLFTFVFYTLAIVGLWLHRRRESVRCITPVTGERKRILKLFVILLAGAWVMSLFQNQPVWGGLLAINFILWTLTGFILMSLALIRGMKEYRQARLRV